VEVYLKQQLHTMEGVIGSKNTEIETLQREIESSKTTYEEKVVYLQMQMAGAKAKDEERGKDTAAHRALVDKLTAQITALQRMIEEKDLSYKSNKDMIQALQSRLIEMEPELAQSRDKLLQFERNNSAQVNPSSTCVKLMCLRLGATCCTQFQSVVTTIATCTGCRPHGLVAQMS
jgi:chromosome segregation ATPase